MAQFLPDLPLIEIFKHLGLVDLTRARAVCRKWRALIDDCVRIEGLAISFEANCKQSKWFQLNKKIGPDNCLELDVIGSEVDFSKFNQTIFRLHLLASLKRLRVARHQRNYAKRFNGWAADRLFGRLIKFPALEHLEIDFNFDHCDELSCELVHPNLRVLSLGSLYSNEEVNIEIDCLRLEVLRCEAPFDQFTVTYPDTIKQLYNYSFRNWKSKNIASQSLLEAFANVERYVCEGLEGLKQVNVWSMPKLKELRVENYWTDECYVASLGRVVADLIAKRERLEAARRSSKIYYNDKECSVNLKESHAYLVDYADAYESVDSTDEDGEYE